MFEVFVALAVCLAIFYVGFRVAPALSTLDRWEEELLDPVKLKEIFSEDST